EDGMRYWSVTGVQTCALPFSGVRLKVLLAGPAFRAAWRRAKLSGVRPRVLRHAFASRLVRHRTRASGLGDDAGRIVADDPGQEKIGRASCRERGEMSGDARGL